MRMVLLAAVAAVVVAFYPHHGTHAPAASSLPVAERSVVKVTGIAECGLVVEGSGFVYAPGRVMTNAHVVAGMRGPQVTTRDGHAVRGRVVVFDPRRDVAIIAVPGLKAKPLDFDDAAGDRTVIAGYPEDGPYAATGASIRSKRRVRESDIYDTASVTLEVYTVHGRVRHGNSGGPLLSPDGKVYGVVYATVTGHEDTGYALTADEVARDATAGEHADRTVSTRSCERERP